MQKRRMARRVEPFEWDRGLVEVQAARKFAVTRTFIVAA